MAKGDVLGYKLIDYQGDECKSTKYAVVVGYFGTWAEAYERVEKSKIDFDSYEIVELIDGEILDSGYKTDEERN